MGRGGERLAEQLINAKVIHGSTDENILVFIAGAHIAKGYNSYVKNV